jgi:hypothetical protein
VTEPASVPPSDDYWRDYLEKGEPHLRFGRKVFSAIPSDPRCRLCTAPFAGLGAPFMRAMGRKPSLANPHLCTACQNALIKHHGGAEVSGTLLFADVRGSTALAERMSPVEFKALMERFYVAASRAVIHHDGAIDKSRRRLPRRSGSSAISSSAPCRSRARSTRSTSWSSEVAHRSGEPAGRSARLLRAAASMHAACQRVLA